MIRSIPPWRWALIIILAVGSRIDLSASEIAEINSPILYDHVPDGESAPPRPNEIWKIPPGPWGELEAYDLTLEPPDAYMERTLENYKKPEIRAWIFKNMSVEKVRELLLKSGVDATTVERLLAPPILEEPEEGRIEIRPPADVIESISTDTRQVLYPLLGDESTTDPFSKPFGIYRSGFEKMSVDSGLPKETVDIISRMTYSKFGSRYFSDIGHVFERAADDAERQSILKTLCRQRSLVLRLTVSSSSDLPAIAKYWSANGLNRDILPILESVRQTDRVEKLDVVHLLPPTPRKFLNTYARPLMSVGPTPPDCFWTALNFFEYEPSDRHYDFDNTTALSPEYYERVAKPLHFGDIILIWNKVTGEPIHACNYIAGEVVFSKDGRSFNRPWVFGRFQDVVSRYLIADTVTVSFFRKRQ